MCSQHLTQNSCSPIEIWPKMKRNMTAATMLSLLPVSLWSRDNMCHDGSFLYLHIKLRANRAIFGWITAFLYVLIRCVSTRHLRFWLRWYLRTDTFPKLNFLSVYTICSLPKYGWNLIRRSLPSGICLFCICAPNHASRTMRLAASHLNCSIHIIFTANKIRRWCTTCDYLVVCEFMRKVNNLANSYQTMSKVMLIALSLMTLTTTL